jgi:hypothetical protein
MKVEAVRSSETLERAYWNRARFHNAETQNMKEKLNSKNIKS